jgi:YHS domain-containing protein
MTGPSDLPISTLFGKEVETTCGSPVTLSQSTAWVLFRDKVVYFCTPDCKKGYEKDPLNSCLAARILSGT